MNTVTNLRVPGNVGKYLSSCVTCGFSQAENEIWCMDLTDLLVRVPRWKFCVTRVERKSAALRSGITP
jgi:hypothetical protein